MACDLLKIGRSVLDEIARRVSGRFGVFADTSDSHVDLWKGGIPFARLTFNQHGTIVCRRREAVVSVSMEDPEFLGKIEKIVLLWASPPVVT